MISHHARFHHAVYPHRLRIGTALMLSVAGLVATAPWGGAAGAPPAAGVPIFQAFINQQISATVASFTWKVPPVNQPGATFTFQSNTSSNGGTLVGQSNGSFVYTPQTDNCGIGFIPFTVTNPDGQSSTGSLELINAPDGVDDTFATPVNTTLTANVGTNDNVGYRPSVQWYRNVYTANPSHGSVTMSPQGTANNAQFTYVPTTGYQGWDSFEYWVECGGKTDVGRVDVAVGSAGASTIPTTVATTTTTTIAPASCTGAHWPSVEAECAALAGTILVENTTLASGGKELGGWDYSGTASVVLTAPAAGTYDLQIRANAPYGVASRTVTVNGVARSFTVSTASRSVVTIPGVALAAGANTFVFSRQNGNDGVANLDNLTAANADPNATTTTTSTSSSTSSTTTTTTITVPGPVSCTPAWPKVEAECATLAGSIQVENATLASGGKELGGWDYSGTATLTLTAPAAGYYDLQIRAIAPYGAASRTVSINGTAIAFPVVSATRAVTVVPTVPLVAGANTIVLSRRSSNDNVVNVDSITAVSSDPNATTTTTSTTTTTTTTTLVSPPACGSSTWPSVEAECATLTGSIQVENANLASGGKELGGWDYSGRAQLVVNAPAAGTYTVSIRAVAPYGAATRTMTINGVARTFSVSTTTRSITQLTGVALQAGANTIVFSRAAGNDNVVNLDAVSFG